MAQGKKDAILTSLPNPRAWLVKIQPGLNFQNSIDDTPFCMWSLKTVLKGWRATHERKSFEPGGRKQTHAHLYIDFLLKVVGTSIAETGVNVALHNRPA